MFPLFYKFRTSKDSEILRQSSYMSHILKELSKRNTHIPNIALFDEDKWHKKCSNAYFGVFRGGGHFWRVTQIHSKRQMNDYQSNINRHTCTMTFYL